MSKNFNRIIIGATSDSQVYYACYYLSLANREIHTLFKDFYNQFRDILAKEVRMYPDSGDR